VTHKKVDLSKRENHHLNRSDASDGDKDWLLEKKQMVAEDCTIAETLNWELASTNYFGVYLSYST
jgi:hypothetical protein